MFFRPCYFFHTRAGCVGFEKYGKFHTFFEAFPIFRYNNQYKVLTINLFLKFQKFLGIKDDSEEEKDGGTE